MNYELNSNILAQKRCWCNIHQKVSKETVGGP